MPFAWKVWCSVSAKTICLTVNEVGGALVLALALAELELELELELEHPAVPSSTAPIMVAILSVDPIDQEQLVLAYMGSAARPEPALEVQR